MRPSKSWSWLCALPLALAAGRAEAHDPFEITTEARLQADRLVLHVAMAAPTAAATCLPAGPDRPRPRRVDAANFPSLRPALETCARGLYAVTAGGRPLEPAEARAALSVEEDVEMTLAYPRPRASPLVFEARFLQRLPDPGYGAVLTVTGDRVFLGQQLLRADDARLVVAAVPGDAAAQPVPPARPPASRYFALGVRHILTGTDHLLFLLGLLLGCRRLRSVLGVVTCFTVAHSLTLALAALGLVTLSPRIVEPFIAATIAFVGLENLFRGDDPRGRLALTFAFGLVHGLGFAGALRETGLGANGAPLALPLLSFNLGVEAGQIAVAAPALLILWWLRATGAFSRLGVRWASLLVAGVGLYWLVERVMA